MKREYPDIKVLIFSGQLETVSVLSAIKTGTTGYLPKTAGPDHSVSTLRKIGKGSMSLHVEPAQRIVVGRNDKKSHWHFRKSAARETEA